MRKIIITGITSFFLAAISQNGRGQGRSGSLEFGVNLGTFIYQGDLSPLALGSLKTPKIGMDIFASRMLSRSVWVRGNLAIAGLKGDDGAYSHPAFRQQRNFKFKSSLVEASLQLIWNPMMDKKFSPYIYGGAGYAFLNIKRDWSQFNTEYFALAPEIAAGLTVDASHRLPRVTPVFPMGIGVRHSLSPKISFHAEISYRFTLTDYLDGFSQAANPSRRDQYYSVVAGIIYTPWKRNSMQCPVINK